MNVLDALDAAGDLLGRDRLRHVGFGGGEFLLGHILIGDRVDGQGWPGGLANDVERLRRPTGLVSANHRLSQPLFQRGHGRFGRHRRQCRGFRQLAVLLLQLELFLFQIARVLFQIALLFLEIVRVAIDFLHPRLELGLFLLEVGPRLIQLRARLLHFGASLVDLGACGRQLLAFLGRPPLVFGAFLAELLHLRFVGATWQACCSASHFSRSAFICARNSASMRATSSSPSLIASAIATLARYAEMFGCSSFIVQAATFSVASTTRCGRSGRMLASVPS